MLTWLADARGSSGASGMPLGPCSSPCVLLLTAMVMQVERLVSKARVWKESEHLFIELKNSVQGFMDKVFAPSLCCCA